MHLVCNSYIIALVCVIYYHSAQWISGEGNRPQTRCQQSLWESSIITLREMDAMHSLPACVMIFQYRAQNTGPIEQPCFGWLERGHSWNAVSLMPQARGVHPHGSSCPCDISQCRAHRGRRFPSRARKINGCIIMRANSFNRHRSSSQAQSTHKRRWANILPRLQENSGRHPRFEGVGVGGGVSTDAAVHTASVRFDLNSQRYTCNRTPTAERKEHVE